MADQEPAEQRTAGSRRDPFLDALDELAALKEALRARYGDFDVDRALEKLRAEKRDHGGRAV